MTREEQLACLIDRPCSVCKNRKENGCCKWTCVFEEKPEDPEPKTGRWINNQCSECGIYNALAYKNWCPNCGAKMEVQSADSD